MRPWLEACTGMERGLGPLQEALGLLMTEAVSNYHDVLGSVYMLLSQGDKRWGQYFTPFHLARMMAEMTLSDLKPREPGERPLTMLEPTCGSGVMILAAAEVIENRYPGMILRGEVLFYGVDLDPLCVTMCKINMLLHRIGHLVRLPDVPGESNEGHTPPFVFQPANIVKGNSLAQDTATLFAQESSWLPVDVVILPTEADNAALREARGTDALQNNEVIYDTLGVTSQTVQRQVPDEGEAASLEEIPPEGNVRKAGTKAEGKQTEKSATSGKQVTADGDPERAGATQEYGLEQPHLLQVPGEICADEATAQHEEALSEVAERAASEALPPDQGGMWQEGLQVQSGNRRKPRDKDTASVVQQDLFSLSS